METRNCYRTTRSLGGARPSPVTQAPSRWTLPGLRWLALAAFGLVIGLMPQARVHAFALNVQGCTPANVCTALPGNFRYLVEQDNSTLNLPQTVQVVPPNGPSATLAIHKSHAPLVTSGVNAASGVNLNVPNNQRYFITVLPNAAYALGGATNYTIETIANWPTAACINTPVAGGTPAQVCYRNSVTVKVAAASAAYRADLASSPTSITTRSTTPGTTSTAA